MWTPTQDFARARLAALDPQDAQAAAALGPYLRHGILTEAQVIAALLRRTSPQAAAGLSAQIIRRLYDRAWLARRPAIWARFRRDLRAALDQIQTQAGLRAGWQAACLGQTGLAAFDAAAHQLAAQQVLPAAAEADFAATWVETLGLPWVLGADFMLRQQIDAEPARILRLWQPQTDRAAPGAARAPGACADLQPGLRSLLIVTEEDLSPDALLARLQPAIVAFLPAAKARSPLQIAPMVQDFVQAAMQDCAARLARAGHRLCWITPADLPRLQAAERIAQSVTSALPVGPAADLLAHSGVVEQPRPFDTAIFAAAETDWPRFVQRLPALLAATRGLRAV